MGFEHCEASFFQRKKKKNFSLFLVYGKQFSIFPSLRSLYIFFYHKNKNAGAEKYPFRFSPNCPSFIFMVFFKMLSYSSEEEEEKKGKGVPLNAYRFLK